MTSSTDAPEPVDETPDGEIPNSETGVGIGAGAPSTFEPEEDEAVEEPAGAPAPDDEDFQQGGSDPAAG